MIAVIFVDNMKIGGYQRLALDQAYSLIDSGYDVKLYVLSESTSWTLVKLEDSLIKQKSLSINSLPQNRLQLIMEVGILVGNFDVNTLIISHSLRATFALRIQKIYSRKNYIITTTIHQIPTLSHLTQRVKRFIYFQFSDELYCFSQAVYDSWNSQFGAKAEFFLSRFGKRINLLRNGVYLERLPQKSDIKNVNVKPRIIFLGRPTFWKGLRTVSQLARQTELNDFDFLFMVPDEPNRELDAIMEQIGDRAFLVKGLTIGSYDPRPGDVHIYPANYGKGVEKIESISLNCLEMGAIGIPSIVSIGGLSTWPEFKKSELFQEVDWGNITSASSEIINASKTIIGKQDLNFIRNLVDIRNVVKFLDVT